MNTDRTEYIKGLRGIADALEADLDLPLPYPGNHSAVTVYTYTKADAAKWTRILTGKREKAVKDTGSFGFEVHGAIHGVAVLILADRSTVCERIVTGTETVTRSIKDQHAVAAAIEAIPAVEVTEQVETVEWKCSPLLEDAVSA